MTYTLPTNRIVDDIGMYDIDTPNKKKVDDVGTCDIYTPNKQGKNEMPVF